MSDSERTGVALLARDSAPPWDLASPRFPVVRRGYDRDAVDYYIADLERELDELRAGPEPSGVISAEIARFGEQTAAILRVAYEAAGETTRRAQTEADRCLAAAASNAVAMTEDARQQLSQLDGETDAIWRERARLLDDVRQLATSLHALAEDALERFPPEADRVTSAPLRNAAVPPPVGAQPVAVETEAIEPADEDGADQHSGGEQAFSDGEEQLEAQTSEFHQDDLDYPGGA